MKWIMLISVLFYFSSSKAQDNSFGDSAVTNSYKEVYQKDNPELKYSYNDEKQIHNYSANWDIDGDGKADSIFFIGNGGAHLFYHLRVILSSEKIIRDYKFISIDLPLLKTFDFFKANWTRDSLIPQFVVADFNHDGIADIYICQDTKANPLPAFWSRKGVTSNHLLLSFTGKAINIKNFTGHEPEHSR
jgi:hypothetical protein